MQTVGLLRSVFINCGTIATVPSKTQITPPPRANAIVGTARPTDATANNAIAVLRNMIILLEELSLPTSTRIAGGSRSRETHAPEKRNWLRHHYCSTPRERRLIKFKFRKRAVRVAMFRRFHCCRCNLILAFRNKTTATQLRHRRDFDLALIRSAAGVFASVVERAMCRRSSCL
jgi:hypothetical protein